jgi:hypothetical protein
VGTTQLKVYQDALRELGQSTVASTSGTDLASLTLAQHYDRTVLYCLEQGYWNFAMNTAQLATEGGTVQFGYTYPYAKPAGWIRTVRLSASSNYWPPLEDYEDAKNRIQANVSPLYMAFIATDGGLGLTTWPENFATYVACELAKRVCKQIGGSQDAHDRMEARTKQVLADALSKDAMNEGVRYPPEGRWVISRRGGSRGDRGNRGSLTG